MTDSESRLTAVSRGWMGGGIEQNRKEKTHGHGQKCVLMAGTGVGRGGRGGYRRISGDGHRLDFGW